MSALFVPYAAAALLLVVAGVPKAIDPEPTQRVARDAGLPDHSAVIRLFGLAEVVVGLAAVLVGGPVPALLVAAAYIGFAVVVARGLIRGDMVSCGCFSGDDSPPSVLHVVIDAALAISALVVALGTPDAWWSLARDEPLPATAVALLTLVVAALVHLALARLPRPDGSLAGIAEVRP